ncbi:MAG: DegV family protein, partial [Peptococcaceae bacterium]|nr:DegV family protein [Peptococcaceae bacterium]
MVQIITDSSTLITVAEGKEMGIDVLPLCVNIMDEDYRDLQVDMDDFYGKIAKGGIPKSSQPLVGEYVEAFKAHA